MSANKVFLLGRVGKDPEVRVTERGKKVANFTLATTETYKDKQGNKQQQTEWHNLVYWGPVVEVIEKFVQKGSLIYVEGKIRSRSYEDKDGVKKYVTEIICSNLSLCGKPTGSVLDGGNERIEDDLPF